MIPICVFAFFILGALAIILSRLNARRSSVKIASNLREALYIGFSEIFILVACVSPILFLHANLINYKAILILSFMVGAAIVKLNLLNRLY